MLKKKSKRAAGERADETPHLGFYRSDSPSESDVGYKPQMFCPTCGMFQSLIPSTNKYTGQACSVCKICGLIYESRLYRRLMHEKYPTMRLTDL